MAYDRAITVFSPDGRLLQVEYAREMVKTGSTSIGLKTRDAVILAAMKISMPLAVPESYKKIYEVDNHIAFVASGSLADARSLATNSRVKAQVNRMTYGELISVNSLATYICDRKHFVTQYGGVRPFGVGLLVGGVDSRGSRLFETEPSGTMIEWKAHAIGRGAERAKKILNSKYKDDLPLEKAIKLVIEALKAAEKGVKAENIDLTVIKKNKVESFDAKVSKYI